MSKYLLFESIVFTDRTLLLAALADLGYPEVEEGVALPLYGYQGDRRRETADLVVRRRFLGSASNDNPREGEQKKQLRVHQRQ